MEFTAQQIAEFLKGTIEGSADVKVSSFSKIENGQAGSLTFLANPKYTEYIYETKASVVLVNSDFEPTKKVSATLIRVENSYSALAQLLELADSVINPKKEGIDSLAFISKSATVGEKSYIGTFAVIGENAKIGEGSQIYPHVCIGDNVQIGKNVTLYAGVTIYKNCKIGNNVIVHAGCVIGSDGFGFAPDEKGVYHKIPQLGNVVIEDDVEIGANTCIDRSSMDGSTVLHKGVKLDNLIQIAHNVTIGDNTVMAAQSGVAGSAQIGKRCMFGGQSGVVGHLSIADDTVLASRTAVSKTIRKPSILEGAPALPSYQYRKATVCYRNLPGMYEQIQKMQAEIDDLKNRK